MNFEGNFLMDQGIAIEHWDTYDKVPRPAFNCGSEPWHEAINEWFRTGIAVSFQRGNFHWGYFRDGLLAGFSALGFTKWTGVGELIIFPMLAVSIDQQGQGLGRFIVEHLISEARDRALLDIAGLAVNVNNAAARKLYERFGFQAFGNPGGPNSDQQRMLLRLT